MSVPNASRKATNLSLDPALIAEARGLGVNVSRAAEAGLREAVRSAKAEAWRRENAGAIASANAWVEANGLPLERYRRF
ncbi:type II toxin-antitoxin system CcdA family antitoxin [Amaricoccus sp. W119]|uniref:type II toxin-antitoxin system CcdA family antitoxin n=1 Tax=Amaricoccus sp. W119 TaxID=3391833 RepID=UPI0039A558B7